MKILIHGTVGVTRADGTPADITSISVEGDQSESPELVAQKYMQAKVELLKGKEEVK